ncbi:unnamed protein product [Auanema sp. JU1783]|nr:unnamed protein product [Auanema sp. JU1783]
MDSKTVEAELSQKHNIFMNTSACISSAKAALRENAASTRREISETFSQLMNMIRTREQELLDEVDKVVRTKETKLAEQQQRVYHGILLCDKILEVVKSRPSEAIQNHDAIMMRLNSIDHTIKDAGMVAFEKDILTFRCAIYTFGFIQDIICNVQSVPSGESLPREIEDYEDDIGMSHKSVFRYAPNRERKVFSAPATTVQQWLTSIPSGAALDADVSTLVAEFEILKANSPTIEIDQSETSSFDVLNDCKGSTDSNTVVSSEFAKMLSRPLSDWLIQNGLSFVDDSSSKGSTISSNRNKRRHSFEDHIKSKRFGFEDIIRNIQMSSSNSWFMGESLDDSEVKCVVHDKASESDSQSASDSDHSNQKLPEAEYIKRLRLMFKMFDPTWGSTSPSSLSNERLDQNSDLYWKQVVDKIQKSYNWLS